MPNAERRSTSGGRDWDTIQNRRRGTLPGDVIRIRGAREHDLKNISLDIPRNKLVVITGLSGSGRLSLAFDTIYAEGAPTTPARKQHV